jgi:hypothetical protein
VTKPPLGVMPAYLWHEANPDPSLAELLDRQREVTAAVRRYLDAGLTVPQPWLSELGIPIRQSRGQP